MCDAEPGLRGAPEFEVRDIAYLGARAEQFPPKHIFGINYGDYKAAHLIISWVGEKLGYLKYELDGNERLPCKPLWIFKPARDKWGKIERACMILSGEMKKLKNMVKTLEDEWRKLDGTTTKSAPQDPSRS